MKNATKKVTEQTAENVNTMIDLTQKTADATLKASVGVAKLAEDSIQGLYKVGYDMNAAGLNVAKGYWDALSAVRNEWINLFSQTGEKAIKSMETMEVPFQKEMTEMSKEVFAKAEKVVEDATAQVKKAVAGK